MDSPRSSFLNPYFPRFPKEVSEFEESFRNLPLTDTPKRFFALKKTIDQQGKLLLPHFGGYYTKLEGRVELYLIDRSQPLFKKTKYKKIKKAFHFIMESSMKVVYAQKILFKKMRINERSHADLRDRFLETIERHKTLYQENPTGLAFPPQVLGIRTKKGRESPHDPIAVIEYVEKRYTDCIHTALLIPLDKKGGGFSNEEAVKGFKEIAQALLGFHKRDWVHQDVKPDNILFEASQKPHFYLFDCECLNTNYDIEDRKRFIFDFKKFTVLNNDVKDPYFIWDSLKWQSGLLTEFTDIYSWTISFGCVIWGKVFYKLAYNRTSLWDLTFENMMLDVFYEILKTEEILNADPAPYLSSMNEDHPNKNVVFHLKAYRFVSRIIKLDIERAMLFQDPEKATKLDKKEEARELLKPLNISMNECIHFCDELLAISHPLG